MRVIPQSIPEVLLIEPRVFDDARGFFFESWHAQRYSDAGMPGSFVQSNVSRSLRGVIRGLHLQHPHGQGKLVSALDGEVLDVAVDLRVGSPTFGRWVGTRLSASNRRQLYIPPGFAHGFCTVSDSALCVYLCTEPFHPECELGVAFDDPDLAITWPVESPIANAKDRSNPRLSAIDPARLPRYSGSSQSG